MHLDGGTGELPPLSGQFLRIPLFFGKKTLPRFHPICLKPYFNASSAVDFVVGS